MSVCDCPTTELHERKINLEKNLIIQWEKWSGYLFLIIQWISGQQITSWNWKAFHISGTELNRFSSYSVLLGTESESDFQRHLSHNTILMSKLISCIDFSVSAQNKWWYYSLSLWLLTIPIPTDRIAFGNIFLFTLLQLFV